MRVFVRHVCCVAVSLALTAAGCARTALDAPCPPSQTPETYCTSVCVDLQSAHDNCGTCGSPCAAGQVCWQGVCRADCGGGTTQCGDACVDTKVDHDNCGGCNIVCPRQNACVHGSCSSTCGAGQSLCGSSKGAYCASVSSDNANCGACGQVCNQSQICSGGACGSTCVAGQQLCTSSGTAYCAELATDNANCGACALTCPNDRTCIKGVCSCTAQLTLCGSQCVDLATNGSNCGSCGALCNGKCDNGRCLELLGTQSGGRSLFVGSGSLVVGGFGSVSLYDLAKDPPPIVPIVNGAGILRIGYVNSDTVYWCADGGLYSMNFKTFSWGDPPTLLDKMPGCDIAGGDNSNLYFYSTSNYAMSIPLGGGTQNNLGVLLAPGTLGASALYALNSQGIVSLPKGGGATSIVAVSPQAQQPGPPVVDATHLFVQDFPGLLSYPLAGGKGTVLVNSSWGPATHIAVDATDVFFTAWPNKLMRVPKTGGAPTLLLTGSIATYQSALAVDATSVYWPDYGDRVWRLTPK